MLIGALAALVALLPAGAADGGKYTLKPTTAAPAKELKAPIADLLSDKAVQVLDEKGELYAEVWFRKVLPSKATPEQVKNGLSYRELDESTVLGAIRFAQQTRDYKRQKVAAGVYTLRLGFQPSDGDHMGTAPHKEFCLLSPAADDVKPDSLETKALQELSSKTFNGKSSHPAVFLLFPNDKPADAPVLADKGQGHWVLSIKEPVAIGTTMSTLGVSLTVVGHSTSE
jgi:hypothetical protein